jgi:hypothetical protein
MDLAAIAHYRHNKPYCFACLLILRPTDILFIEPQYTSCGCRCHSLFRSLGNQHVCHRLHLARASLVLYVVTDLLVALLLCYFLHSSRTGIKRTDTLINKLIVYAIHNGLITSVADIFVIAFNIAYPKNLVYLSIYQIVANLYSNSFLATLNARRPTKSVNDNFSTTDNANTLCFATFGAHSQSLADTARAGNTNKRHVDVSDTSTVDVMGDTDRNSSL